MGIMNYVLYSLQNTDGTIFLAYSDWYIEKHDSLYFEGDDHDEVFLTYKLQCMPTFRMSSERSISECECCDNANPYL